MNLEPEPDFRAQQLDDALERRHSDHDETLDAELQELLALADRLNDELPDDLPDPAFRESLKHQILQGAVQLPPRYHQEPVDLSSERWYRRLITSPWRIGAAATACVAVIIVAFIAATGPFSDGSDNGGEETTSFQPVGVSDPTTSSQSSQTPLDSSDDAPVAERWFTTSFPPFDVEHMVLPPMMIGFMPLSERRRPEVELLGAMDMVDGVDLPETATVYYLNSPPDPDSMLASLSSTLGIEGDIVPGNGDGEPYRLVDDDGNDIMRWDVTSAFFHFRGDVLSEPVMDLLDEGADASSIARRFLELIGFDLHTIEYETQISQNDESSEVRFQPIDIPETALDVTLGGTVFIGEHGQVLEAQLYWLSLVDAEVVQLRETSDIIDDIQDGSGYTPPPADESDEVMIEVDDLQIVHVLTRLGTSHFVLQPAVKFLGEYGNDAVSELPGPARYLVPAVDSPD